MEEFYDNARVLVADGKGILAADEDMATLGSRFGEFDIVLTTERQQAYRELLFTAPGLEQFVSGVILADDTIRQGTSDGTSFSQLLVSKGMIPGINVDKGLDRLALSDGELVTEGLDGLRGRLGEYHGLGARFTKWRAAFSVGGGRPSEHCARVNAHAMVRFAALSQEMGLTPIVEPDVMMDGAHSVEDSARATGRVLKALYDEIYDQRVAPEGTLLKTNMVLSGYGAPRRASAQEVAEATLAVLYRYVPAAVPGVVFLSGGQGDEDATAHLNAINQAGPHPWRLSFSYARALQRGALETWRGSAGNGEAAQGILCHRAMMNSAASKGGYSPEMEKGVRNGQDVSR